MSQWFILAIFLALFAVTSAVDPEYSVLSGEAYSPLVESPLFRMRRAANTSLVNKTTVVKDSHVYYQSTIIIEEKLANRYMNKFKEAYTLKYKTHSYLTNAHRIGLQLGMSFPFLFYGHVVQKVTIATGGFLYMSDFLHKYLTFSQYIAPLMADFHAGIGDGDIRYADTGDAFFVMWEKIRLKDQSTVGPFTFEVILFKNGTIVFAYKDVPISVANISSTKHVVKIGIADAFYQDQSHSNKKYFTRRIMQYHSVQIKKAFITSNTVIIFHPVPTCVQQKSCKSCISSKTTFDCAWCSKVGRCSSGTDRLKQNWEMNSCHKVNQKRDCPFTALETGVAILVALIIIILIIAIGAFGYWVYYAYTNPATPSGMWLMEHRPSVLRTRFATWRSGGTNANNASSEIYRVETTA